MYHYVTLYTCTERESEREREREGGRRRGGEGERETYIEANAVFLLVSNLLKSNGTHSSVLLFVHQH